MKALIISAPVLAHPEFKKSFILETDTSNFATGSVILQLREDGFEHPVSLTIKKMQLTKTNYLIYNEESLAILNALVKWQNCLVYARHLFLVLIDHKVLEYHKSPRRMNQRQSW